MESLNSYLEEQLKDPAFKTVFEEEKRLLELGLRIAETRQRLGISQKELAARSRVTQQQISKVENGVNCNILTFIRISDTLGIPLSLAAS